MDYTAGNSFGYDQVAVETPLYFNKGDTSILMKDRSHPDNEVKRYLNDMGKKPKGSDAAFQYYLRRNIKDEIEKYEQRKQKYTGVRADTVPHSDEYPLCDPRSHQGEKPKDRAHVQVGCIARRDGKNCSRVDCHACNENGSCNSMSCKACQEGGVMDFHKKYDNILFIILVVVAAFCLMQYSNIQQLQTQLQKLTFMPKPATPTS